MSRILSDQYPPRETAQLPLDLPPRAPRTAALRSFHVRSHMSVSEAIEGEHKAQRQEYAILEWFRVMDEGPGCQIQGFRWTPSSVSRAFPQWPLTSIRRALTNLTTHGLLLHHKADRRPGPYGAKESTWSLA